MRDLILIFMWMYGIMLSKGTSMIWLAIFFPPYTWYLVVEKIVKTFGLL